MTTSGPSNKIPLLRNGDRLAWPEFERRYGAMPRLKKAELIDGVVYVDPTTCDSHGRAHAALTQWLGFYCLGTPHLFSSVLGSIRFDYDNEFQPDVHLRIAPEAGGLATIGEGHIVEGPPDLVGEVTFSGVSHELHAKRDVYRRNGVLEYIAWRLEDGVIDWFVLRDGRYNRLNADPDGRVRSVAFPGLWLDPSALLRGDLGSVSRAVRDGLASQEHAAFVARLLNAGEPH